MFDIFFGISDFLSQYFWYRSSCIQMSDLSYLWYIPVSLMSCHQYSWYLTIAYIWYPLFSTRYLFFSSLWYFPRCLFSSTPLDILILLGCPPDIRPYHTGYPVWSPLFYFPLVSIVISHPFMRNKPDTIYFVLSIFSRYPGKWSADQVTGITSFFIFSDNLFSLFFVSI